MEDEHEQTILDKVMEFCLSNDFEQRFNNFASRHLATFAAADTLTSEEEHPLEYHQVYQQYLKEFEGYIERKQLEPELQWMLLIFEPQSLSKATAIICRSFINKQRKP